MKSFIIFHMERDVVTKSFDAISWTCMFIVVVVKLISFDFYKEERKIIATNSIWFQRYNTVLYVFVFDEIAKKNSSTHSSCGVIDAMTKSSGAIVNAYINTTMLHH